VNRDGTGEMRLTTEPDIDASPAWSPDGSKIAFYSDRSGIDIWIMSADGSDQVNLTAAWTIQMPRNTIPTGSRSAR
jgi:TolB protein